MSRESPYSRSLGKSLADTIKNSKVLMVGAGGIGCELLKNLALTGFGEIHIVDLDTVDLSNLNRQFLFNRSHIKKSKALVAKETASKFNPHVKMVAYHSNIKDTTLFDIDWFKSFKIVFNALDNLDARRYVNKMCMAAEVPLIESGTTGYNGQVQVICGTKTECYDCKPKATPKVYPVCTIRSTPSQIVHCVVWAKSFLFAQLFDQTEETSQFDESMDNVENNEEDLKTLKQEENELKSLRDSILDSNAAQLIFNKVFKTDIDRLLSMDTMWKTRTKPTALDYNILQESTKGISRNIINNDQKKWSLQECFVVFKDSLHRLQTRLKFDLNPADSLQTISFDKDDDDTLDFVVAASNIRSIIFSIETKSKFDTKQIAGNIIPAIATTNAIVAGICVLESFKVLKNDIEKARFVFLTPKHHDKVLTATKLQPPNPDCPVSSVARSTISMNTQIIQLRDLLQSLKTNFNYTDEICLISDGKLVYDIDFDDNLDRPVKDLGIADGTFLTVIDEAEDGDGKSFINLELYIKHNPAIGSPDSGLISSIKFSHIPIIPKRNSDNLNDDVIIAVNGDERNIVGSSKRKAPESTPELVESSKKLKLSEKEDKDGAIILDDDDEIISFD
ncbi:hypothetical protein NADFUDRAFT_68648 [Nadsonia fulvescens var. elongata DSM 6958]|uniref:Ubiquitin-activating enzyme E1-like n=1 Tax=Nadsonia fulvescens var. elongata DSM 6958 TaxID=857566 RepID=A0A1E3PSK9_9ASCO|nr:hypothetical protein NADFUDRAFT_68648 [Nadsonia fulvescens var. elongata DSM 6958]